MDKQLKRSPAVVEQVKNIYYYSNMSGIVPKEHRLAGQGAVLAAAFLWSTSGLLIKLVNWHPIVIAGSRSFVAALFILTIRFIYPSKTNVKNPPFPFWAAALMNTLTMLTFVVANKLTASANVILLQYSAPIWTAIFGWFLIKEKPRWEQWGALALVVPGLLLFFRDGLASGSILGDLIAVISGVFYGVHSVILRMMKDGNPRDSILMSHVLCALISIPFAFQNPPSVSFFSVMPILLMGTLQNGLASVLLAYGIKRITAIQVMLIAMLEPVLNPVWVLVVTGERPSLSAIAGGGIIVSAVVISSIIGRRSETRKQI